MLTQEFQFPMKINFIYTCQVTCEPRCMMSLINIYMEGQVYDRTVYTRYLMLTGHHSGRSHVSRFGIFARISCISSCVLQHQLVLENHRPASQQLEASSFLAHEHVPNFDSRSRQLELTVDHSTHKNVNAWQHDFINRLKPPPPLLLFIAATWNSVPWREYGEDTLMQACIYYCT